MAEVRFAFGENWRSFLETLDEDRIRTAEASLLARLGADGILGRTFLDIGSGSGLFSLAACRLGASRVVSFDYDPASVACAETLRTRFGVSAERWRISHGSVLDAPFMAGLGTFDVVYSWGVLHHTGAMWDAIDRATRAVGGGGRFFIALYNDQGMQSQVWWQIKRAYAGGPAVVRGALLGASAAVIETGRFVSRLIHRRNPAPWVYWREYRQQRGMSVFHDYRDWVGGFPFEVATPAEVEAFVTARGFTLTGSTLVGRKMGCNEFVFRRSA